MKKIFEPFATHNLGARNRLVRSATWENLATPEGGICANSYALYDQLAAGGVGTIITGFTSVDANDRYFGGMMRLSSVSLVPEYKKLVDIIKKHGVAVLTQLALGVYYAKGRDGRFGEVEIDYMSHEQILDMVSKFVEAARLAGEAGSPYGYTNIILAGHSLGANKVIHYLAHVRETPVKRYILVSPANMKFMLANVTGAERRMIREYVKSGKGNQMLPFPFMGWSPMVASTAWQWLWRNPLDNIHSDPDGDFSEVAKIRQIGALIIGTYDRFSYGEPKAFIELINAHTREPDKNEVIFVEGTGHVYTEREQMLADIILRVAQKWQ